MSYDNGNYIKYIQSNKCWCFLKHTFLRFSEDPLFVDNVIIDGQKYKATRCYGSPPFVIQIKGEHDFKNLNVGFIMPSKEEQRKRVENILVEVENIE